MQLSAILPTKRSDPISCECKKGCVNMEFKEVVVLWAAPPPHIYIYIYIYTYRLRFVYIAKRNASHEKKRPDQL